MQADDPRPNDEVHRHLREIVDAYFRCPTDASCQTRLLGLDKALEKARLYLVGLDACEYQTEDGIKCPDKGERQSHKMWCCLHHASIRDSWYS